MSDIKEIVQCITIGKETYVPEWYYNKQVKAGNDMIFKLRKLLSESNDAINAAYSELTCAEKGDKEGELANNAKVYEFRKKLLNNQI